MSDLSYYVGRRFEKIDQGEEGWNWTVVLEGDARVRNTDEARSWTQENLEGTIFLRPIFSELDTRMQFGMGENVTAEIVLTPTKYTVADPTYASGEEEIYPQAPPIQEIPPDPSDERVVDQAEGGENMSETQQEPQEEEAATEEESSEESEEGTEEETTT